MRPTVRSRPGSASDTSTLRPSRHFSEAFELRRRSADAEQKIRKLEEERKTIDKAQERIRENLKSLGDRSSEKELRERFVRTLNGQEDRLEAIAAEVATLTLERDRLRQEMADVIWKLNYAADLGPREAPRARKGRKSQDSGGTLRPSDSRAQSASD